MQFYLLIAVCTASLGQFTLRIRPEDGGSVTSLIYLGISLIFYGTSFLLTSIALPSSNGSLAILTLSLQYPFLYILFSLQEKGKIGWESVVYLTIGYLMVGIGLTKNTV